MSYYALFQGWLLLSQPPGCLGDPTSFPTYSTEHGGATSSIIFSYFMELEAPIKPDLGATLLFGIESDLAGAAGTTGRAG